MSMPAPQPEVPGRNCPVGYRIAASEFLAADPRDCDILYVAGGVYGNPFALEEILAMLAREPGESRRLVLNGDFHWFDAEPEAFARVQALARDPACDRLRGNVETELVGENAEAGCGCAYPPEVGDAEVGRSNRIAARLSRIAREGGQARELAGLARVARYRVGGAMVAITHGDDRSMAGWSLAHDRIDQRIAAGLAQDMRTIGASVLASSHTCLPCARSDGDAERPWAVFNNGSAGMANFAGDRAGLITRIARIDLGEPPISPVYGVRQQGLRIDALPVVFDFDAWWRTFRGIWPPGSDADLSYAGRIRQGPSHTIDDALGLDRRRA